MAVGSPGLITIDPTYCGFTLVCISVKEIGYYIEQKT